MQRITANLDETEEIVQETFLRLWRSMGRYSADQPLFPLLAVIAVNLARDRWRRRRGFTFEDLDAGEGAIPDEGRPLEIRVERAQALESLSEAVGELPPAYRAVIALRYDAGLSYQEIAGALDLPVNTVRTHLRRAKQRLWEVLQNEEATDA